MEIFKRKGAKKPYLKKLCPECGTYLPVNSEECYNCGKKVGHVDELGMAKRPIDWKTNIYCIVLWLLFGFYIWWAFIRE